MPTVLDIRCLLPVFMLGFTMPWAQGAEGVPSLETIRERAKRREARFDSYDGRMTAEWWNPGQSSPHSVQTGRYVRSGSKRRVDVEQRLHDKPGHDIRRRYLFTFDGRTARSLEPKSQKGKVYRDLESDLKRKGYFGPETLGIVIPGTDGRRLSAVLEGESLTSKVFGLVRKTFTVLPPEEIDGESVWPLEVALTDGSARAESHLIFLSERYDLAPLRVDHFMTVDGKKRLLERLSLSDFKELQEGVWYPTRGRYETFQFKAEPQQTVNYRIDGIAWPGNFDDGLFTLTFPAGTHVFDEIIGVDFFAGGDLRKSPLRDVEHLLAGASEPAAQAAQAPLKVPVPSPTNEPRNVGHGFKWSIGIIVAGIVLLLVGVLGWRRKSFRRDHSTLT